jgi:hypothetical protein
MMHTLNKHGNKIAWVLILFTFLAGVAYSISLKNHFRYHDEKEYFLIAQNIATHGTFSISDDEPTAWRPPGYPFLLAPFIWAGADVIGCRIVNFVFFCLGLYLIYHFLARHSKLAGILGIFLVLCYPVLFYAAGTLYPQTIAGTLSLLLIYLLFAEDEELTPLKVLLAGALTGLLILIVPTYIMSFILTALWILFINKRERWSSLFTYVVAVILMLTPWTVRNFALFGEFVFISTNGGINFLLGNSANSEANLGVNVDLSSYKRPRSFDEAQTDKLMRYYAFKHIYQHRWESLKLYVSKFVNYFNYRNVLATASEASKTRDITMLITYGFLLGVALVRLGLGYKYPIRDYEAYIYILYVFSALFMALFFTRIRFRLPYDLTLVLINARFLAILLSRRLDLSRRI